MSIEFAGMTEGLGYTGPVDSMMVPAGSGLAGSYGICDGLTRIGGGRVCCAVAVEVQTHISARPNVMTARK